MAMALNNIVLTIQAFLHPVFPNFPTFRSSVAFPFAFATRLSFSFDANNWFPRLFAAHLVTCFSSVTRDILLFQGEKFLVFSFVDWLWFLLVLAGRSGNSLRRGLVLTCCSVFSCFLTTNTLAVLTASVPCSLRTHPIGVRWSVRPNKLTVLGLRSNR